jgi:hypothetical protein
MKIAKWGTGEITDRGKPKYAAENLPQSTLCLSQISLGLMWD